APRAVRGSTWASAAGRVTMMRASHHKGLYRPLLAPLPEPVWCRFGTGSGRYRSQAEPASSDHHDRAGRMMHHLAANRTHDQLREPACATRSDNQKVSVTGGLDQLLGRKAYDRAHRD